MGLNFKEDRKESEILIKWWASLQEDKGARAELRKCHELPEVFMQSSFHRLYNSFKNFGDVNEEGLATVAGLLSNIKDNNSLNIASQMARDINGQENTKEEKAVIKGLRFRRILKIQNHSELFPVMIRIIKHLKGLVNITDLANSAYYWNDSTKKTWAFKYYEHIQIEKKEK